MRSKVPGSEHRQQQAIRQPKFIVTRPLSQAKGWLYRLGTRLTTKAISPQEGCELESPGGCVGNSTSRTSSLRSASRSMGISSRPRAGPGIVCRSPLSQTPRRPGTQSSASNKDSCTGSWMIRPNLRTRRTRRAEQPGHATGSVRRMGRSLEASAAASASEAAAASVSSQAPRRRIKWSGTRFFPCRSFRLRRRWPWRRNLVRRSLVMEPVTQDPRIITPLLWSSRRRLIIVRDFPKQPASPPSFADRALRDW